MWTSLGVTEPKSSRYWGAAEYEKRLLSFQGQPLPESTTHELASEGFAFDAERGVHCELCGRRLDDQALPLQHLNFQHSDFCPWRGNRYVSIPDTRLARSTASLEEPLDKAKRILRNLGQVQQSLDRMKVECVNTHVA